MRSQATTDLVELRDTAMELRDELAEVIHKIAGLQSDCEHNSQAESVGRRMHAYLVSHLELSLGGDNEWLGSNPCSMQNVIDELNEAIVADEEETL